MATAVFHQENHTYELDGKTLISVTQLMRKHGLAPDYSGVNEEVLRKKAERGTLIHAEIENFIKTSEFGFTDELGEFIRLAAELGLENLRSEVIVNNDIVAGTADIMATAERDGKTVSVLLDIKTTTKLDRRALEWQLALYAYLSGEQFTEFYALHLREDNGEAVAIKPVAVEEVEKLLECERNGEIYTQPGLLVPTELLARAQEAEHELARVEQLKKDAEAVAKNYRQRLYELMEQQGIASWETADKSMLITRVAPVTKTTIDSTRLKKEQPEIAEQYSKTTTVSGYVKITIREG